MRTIVKQHFNLSIEKKVVQEFRATLKKHGLTASQVIELFMRAVIADEPLDRAERFVNIIKEFKKQLR